MIISKHKNKAQSLFEYCILLIIVIVVFIVMSSYLKRGFQGMLKSKTDQLGDQYDPRTTNAFINNVLTSTSNTFVDIVPSTNGTFWTQRIDASSSVESKGGQSSVGSL